VLEPLVALGQLDDIFEDQRHSYHTALRLWTPSVAELTSVDLSLVIPVYKDLLLHLDAGQFKHKLRADPALWIGE
jgi:hypothetical protein